MSLLELLILSASLALDTFGVALAAGALHRKMKFSGIFRIAATFGVFHVLYAASRVSFGESS
jgi:putative Mn2+ efflux pump MntP